MAKKSVAHPWGDCQEFPDGGKERANSFGHIEHISTKDHFKAIWELPAQHGNLRHISPAEASRPGSLLNHLPAEVRAQATRLTGAVW